MTLAAEAAAKSPCEKGLNACSILFDVTENEKWSTTLGGILDKTFYVIVILVIALIAKSILHRLIAKVVSKVVKASEKQKNADWNKLIDARSRREQIVGNRSEQRSATLTTVLQYAVSVVIYVSAILIILAQLGINIGPLLASAGVVGLAVGFGAQNLVKDYVSGVFMLMEDQYGVGDWVDVGDAQGTVEDMGLRVTTIRDISGTLWYVRNGEILRVGNSSQSWAYVNIDTPLSSQIDTEAAATGIMGAVREVAADRQWSQFILSDPEYQGVVSMNIDETVVRVALKTTSSEQWAIGRELRRRIGDRLHNEGFTTHASRVFVPRGSIGGAQ
ncbi:mechanosensitive ion channel family protein [Salininema proteolyticum]|uniref:Mechanosensitive ion channel family protein n=1 Tax=Salininema proteolyticum TaxID=1607685 RepID=A0ABV8TUM3_9ACTN